MEIFLCNLPHVFRRYLRDVIAERLKKIGRVTAKCQHHLLKSNLAAAIKLKNERIGERILCPLQLVCRHRCLPQIADDVNNQRDCLGGFIGARLRIRKPLTRIRVITRLHQTAHHIGEPVLLAHLPHQPRRKPAFTENLVHDAEREVVRKIRRALDTEMPD